MVEVSGLPGAGADAEPGTKALCEVAPGAGGRFRTLWGRGRQKLGSGTRVEMVLAMLGALYPRARLSLFLLYFVLAAALLRPQPLRYLQGTGSAPQGRGAREVGALPCCPRHPGG